MNPTARPRFAEHLLRVDVPLVRGQNARERASAPIADRLACNVAALFGVPWPDNPAGRTWAVRYDDVSLKEIGLGVIGSTSPLVDDIAPSTLNRFRPDRKAGTVLAGANRLFDSLTPVFDEVLLTIASTEDRDPLAPEIRLAIWATLVQEAYKSQPALFAAAVTARRIQRALTPGWSLVLAQSPQQSEDATRGEPGLTSLHLLDDTIVDFDGQRVERTGAAANSTFLAEDLIERWTKHLLSSFDSVIAWVDSDATGRTEADAFVASLNALNSFLDEFSSPSVEPNDPALEPQLLLPRIPGVGEALRLSAQGRRTSILCIMQVHRLLRDNPRYDDAVPRFQARVTAEAEQLADLAARTLDPADPLVILARARWLNKAAVDIRERDWPEARDKMIELRSEIDRLHEACEDGRLSRGTFVDEVRTFSVLFSSVRGDAMRMGDTELAELLERGLRRDWNAFFDLIGIGADDFFDEPSRRPEWSRNIDGHLHGYCDLLIGSESLDDRIRGIDLLRRVVVPARRQWDPNSQTRSPLRISLQLLIRAIDRHLRDLQDSPEANELALLASDATVEILRIPEVKRLLSKESTRVRSGQVNTLTAIVTGALVASERGVLTDTLAALDLSRLIATAIEQLSARSKDGTSGRLVQACALAQRVADSSRKR